MKGCTGSIGKRYTFYTAFLILGKYAKEIMFNVLFGGLLCVCQQNYRNTIGPIFMKLGGRVKHEPRENPLNLGVDPNHGVDTQIIFHFH